MIALKKQMPNDKWKKNTNNKYKTLFEWWLEV